MLSRELGKEDDKNMTKTLNQKCVPWQNQHLFLLQVINIPVSWLCNWSSTPGTLLPVETSSCQKFEDLQKSLRDAIFLTHTIHCNDFAQAPYQGLSCQWRPPASSFENLWRMQKDWENTNRNNNIEKLLLQPSLTVADLLTAMYHWAIYCLICHQKSMH